MTYLYWIYNDDCIDPFVHGYIGITENVQQRFKQHLSKNSRILKDSKYKILFEGSRLECFNLENNYRPNKGIGWNSASGGKHGWKTGFVHSEETKYKLKIAWTDERKQIASIFKAEENKKLKGQKRPKQSKSMTGELNPMYGTIRPEHVKLAVSLAHLGKPAHNKMELYCVHCRKRASMSILKKYHGVGKINCEELSNDHA